MSIEHVMPQEWRKEWPGPEEDEVGMARDELVHEIVGIGQSRRVESYWTRTSITDPATGVLVATVLLHQGVFKASYDKYPADKLA
jgi:hypothetical protein